MAEEARSEALREACLATLTAMNEMLAAQFPNLNVRLSMVDAQEARELRRVFSPTDQNRVVDWDWEQLFHKRVKGHRPAWMFLMALANRHGAVCYGTIQIQDGYVSIERLERNVGVPELKGLVALIAVRYAEALAVYLDLSEVRLCKPDPALISFYEQRLGLTRHVNGQEVPYLYKKVKP